MKLKTAILALSLIVFNCVYFIMPSEVSQIKKDIILQGSEIEKVYKQVCKDYINFEALLNERKIDKNKIKSICVEERELKIKVIDKNNWTEIYTVQLEKYGKISLAISIRLIASFKLWN